MANDPGNRLTDELTPGGPVVEMRVVSPAGARVTETVFVLSRSASRQLEIRGEVPRRFG